MASSRLLFDPRAEAELHDAIAWYEDRLDGLGLRFLATVERKLADILEAPQRWPLTRGTRRVLLGRFPYAIVYREISEDEIEVVAIAHLRRASGYWSKR